MALFVGGFDELPLVPDLLGIYTTPELNGNRVTRLHCTRLLQLEKRAPLVSYLTIFNPIFDSLTMGKNMGNQENMPGVCVSGLMLSMMSLYRTVSK